MKTMIAAILAATLALTTTAAPVQAADRDDEIAAILFGLATLAIIGRAIENDRKSDRPRTQANVTPTRPRGPAAIPANRRVLPRECFVRVDTRGGPVRMFGDRCLRRNYAYADQLPRRCQITVDGSRHARSGYSPQCLRSRGFSMARH